MAAPLRVAVIGAGFISAYHVDGLRSAGGATVAALVGRDAARTAARAAALGVERWETDPEAVLADPSVDAVVVATPDASHETLATAALERGKAVLVQKPMAADAHACRRMIAAAERTGTLLSVSFMHRHFPEVVWLRELLRTGALGRVATVRLRNATPGADWDAWFYDPTLAAGGVVMQLGVHGIDLCRHLLGPVEDVFARAVTTRPERRLADGSTVLSVLEDDVVASYRLGDGTLVSHEMSYTERAGTDRFRLEVHAEHGTAWLRTEKGEAALFAPEVTGRAEWMRPPLSDEPAAGRHHRAWLAAVRGETADDTAAAGLASVEVAEAIYASARTGAPVTVGIAP